MVYVDSYRLFPTSKVQPINFKLVTENKELAIKLLDQESADLLLIKDNRKSFSQYLKNNFNIEYDIINNLGLNELDNIILNSVYSYYKSATGEKRLVRWYTNIDGRQCTKCGPLNGKVLNINSAPKPPLHPNCRCSLIPMDMPLTMENTNKSISIVLDFAGKAVEFIFPGSKERASKFINSPYDFINWLTIGTLDTLKDAVSPKKPLSFEHWLNSAKAVALLIPTGRGLKNGITGLISLKKNIVRNSKNKVVQVVVSEETLKEAVNSTKVGRWMSQAEYDAMIKTGKVQESFTGTTHVASPADISAFGKQAKPCSIYVEFDVPSSSLKPTNEGWAKILGPNSLEGRLAVKKGQPIPQMPSASNIEIMGGK